MSTFYDNAKRILDSVELTDPKVLEAKALLSEVHKTAASKDNSSATFQNIVTLLTPFVVNYKVNQVMKLLKELAKEQQIGHVDPSTGFKKYL